MLSVMMISVVCGAVLISAVSALYQARPPLYQYGPRHPGTYGGAGGHGGGGVDPLTLLLLQKNGGTGNASVGNIGIKFFFFVGGINSLLPLLLTSGGLGGKKGGINPLLLTSLLGEEKCVEQYPDGCTQPATANTNGDNLCGTNNPDDSMPECGLDFNLYYCCPCCTCPDSANAPVGTCNPPP